MGNHSLGWKIFGLFVSIGLIIGGLSGEWVLRGTESSSALVVVGFLFLIWDIYAIATHKKQQAVMVDENHAEAEVNAIVEENEEPLPAALNLMPAEDHIHDAARKQEDASFSPPLKYNGIQWFFRAFLHFADFSGRARRTEYWMFTLFNILFYFAWAILTGVIFALANGRETGLTVSLYGYFMIMMLPGMAVSVRRLHDTGKSGWMLLVGLIPLVGGIWLLILMLTEGDAEENKYGPNPKTQYKPISEKTKLKNAAITLTVAASLYVLMLVVRTMAFHVGYHVSVFPNLLLIAAGILLLVAGIFLLSESTIYDLRAKGKQALLLLLISVSIWLLMECYFLIKNFAYYGWVHISAAIIHVLLYGSLGFLFVTLLYRPQYRHLVRRVAVCAIVFAGLTIAGYVFKNIRLGGGEFIINYVGLFYFLLPVSFMMLVATFLSKPVESVPALMPIAAQDHARVTTSRFERCEQKPYVMLEHTIGSRYHHVGELQKIVADQVEIGRDPACEVRFDENFETVSRRHATIMREGNHWKFVPLSQTNSSFINGQIVHSEWYLQDGDEIQCAVNGPKLVFRTDATNL